MASSDDKKVDEIRRDYIDRQIKDYPRPINDAEQEYFNKIAWTDIDQFDILVDGKIVALEDLEEVSEPTN